MLRRLSRFAFLLIIAGTALAGMSRAAEPPKQPNILMIYCDDHALQAISAYRQATAEKLDLIDTPNIDRLAKEGMRFDRCYVTNSICGPCRAVIQTGKYSHLNGFYCNGNRFDGSQQTFPKLLQQAGYQTAVVGKWHLESDPQGFDYWNILIGQGPYYNPPMIENGERKQHTGYTTHIITEFALDWLKNQRDQNKPFMLMYQHKAPHREWEPGPNYLTMFDDREMPEPSTLFDDYSGRGTAARTQDMSIEKTMTEKDLKLVAPKNLTPEQLEAWNKAYEPKNAAFREANLQGKDLVRWKYQRYIKDYLRCVKAVDDDLGRVLKYLDDAGLADNTVVVYSSDQGFYLGEHGWFDKRWIYRESLGTPLLVRWPGVVKPGSVNSEDIVSSVDFAETFLDVAGVAVPSDMQGRSFVPLLKGNTPDDWRKTFYYHYYEYPAVHSVRRHYGVTDGRYKLIHFYPNRFDPQPIDEWELYDLEKDPKELQSVYGNPEYAAVQERLTKELARLRAELNVPEEDPEESGTGPLSKRAKQKGKAKAKAK
ncbi:MAG: sulfatase [Planctomycetota bacterium]